MSDFGWVKNLSEEDLGSLCEQVELPVFYSVNRVKKWAVGAFTAGGCGAGIGILYEILDRHQWREGGMLLWAIGGAVGLFLIFKAEDRHNRKREAVRAEISRRYREQIPTK